MTKLFTYAGIAASVILIAFGVGAIYTGFDGRDQVRGDLAREQIVGTDDSTIPGQKVDTGSEAQAFAAVIRKHTLEATGGQTYSQMGRFLDDNGKATSDEKLAATDPKTGQPVENGLRDMWVNVDGAVDRAQHGVLRRERRDLRHRHGLRPAAHRHRVPRAHREAARAAHGKREGTDRVGGPRTVLTVRSQSAAG